MIFRGPRLSHCINYVLNAVWCISIWSFSFQTSEVRRGAYLRRTKDSRSASFLGEPNAAYYRPSRGLDRWRFFPVPKKCDRKCFYCIQLPMTRNLLDGFVWFLDKLLDICTICHLSIFGPKNITKWTNRLRRENIYLRRYTSFSRKCHFLWKCSRFLEPKICLWTNRMQFWQHCQRFL